MSPACRFRGWALNVRLAATAAKSPPASISSSVSDPAVSPLAAEMPEGSDSESHSSESKSEISAATAGGNVVNGKPTGIRVLLDADGDYSGICCCCHINTSACCWSAANVGGCCAGGDCGGGWWGSGAAAISSSAHRNDFFRRPNGSDTASLKKLEIQPCSLHEPDWPFRPEFLSLVTADRAGPYNSECIVGTEN